MSANETPVPTFDSEAMITFKKHYGKVNNCIHLLEKNVYLAFLLDYLSVKEDQKVYKALQKEKYYCEGLEMANLHKLQETQEDINRKTENSVKVIVKNSFKDVCSNLAQYYPKPECQYVHGELPKEVLEVQQLFMYRLKKIVTDHLSYKKEESVPEEVPDELDYALNVIVDQLGAKVNEKDSMIDKCKCGIMKLKLKMEKLPEEVCDESNFSVAKLSQNSLKEELDQLSVQLHNLYLENRDKERQIQEETEKVQNETEYMFECFDDFMEKEQADVEAREKELLRDEVELMKTEELCAALKVEYTEVMERRRLAEEARQEQITMLQLQTREAIIAQAWWRGYRLRKAMKNQSMKKDRKDKDKKI